MMVTPNNGESIHDDTSSTELIMLESMFEAPAPPYINDLLCEYDKCSHVACWKVIWDDGACVCLPAEVCSLGKILIEDAMEKLDQLVCSNCRLALVPAIIVPLYSKGRFL
jgi:hypothetical protein